MNANPTLLADREIVGQAGEPGQGPWMRLLLRFDGEKFTDAKFETYGCPTAMRCGDWLCKWLIGRTPEQVQGIEAKDLVIVIGGVPLGKEFCADLAVQALRCGLNQA
jgi:NifU-like protein